MKEIQGVPGESLHSFVKRCIAAAFFTQAHVVSAIYAGKRVSIYAEDSLEYAYAKFETLIPFSYYNKEI